MSSFGIPQIRSEIKHLSDGDLRENLLRLAKYKKENKELLAYLLFEAHDQESFIERVRIELEENFEEMNRSNFYYIKKTVRKNLRLVRKYIRFSGEPETEVRLYKLFLSMLRDIRPSYTRNSVLIGIYTRTLLSLNSKLKKLHPDIQFDIRSEMEAEGLISK